MSPRDTSTGRVLENMILPALRRGGYFYETQQDVGNRIGGGRHLVDVIAQKRLVHGKKVTILTLEGFIAKANQGKL